MATATAKNTEAKAANDDPKAIEARNAEYLAANPCFGNHDPADKGCEGGKKACKARQKEVFTACKASKEAKAVEAAKKKSSKKGAGSTVFGHRNGTIAGKIDTALLAHPKGITLKSLAAKAECTEARVKDHIFKDIAVGKRTGGTIVANISYADEKQTKICVVAGK